MNKQGLSRLRFKKLKELISNALGHWFTFTKSGEIRYERTLLRYIFKPKFTTILEFCMCKLPGVYNISDIKHTHTMETIIDTAYSNFILGEYSILDKGADFKFNTIRNIFRYRFRTKEYMINHYSNRLSIPIIRILKQEFTDKDILNIVIPARINIMAVVRNFEEGAYDYIRREFNLVRAGPSNLRSPLFEALVA